MKEDFNSLLENLKKCEICKEEFGFQPHPIFLGNANSKIVQISQAPSATVHKTLKPFTDQSGKKLKYEKLADDIREYIDERYTDPGLSVDMIASHVGRSANYSRTIFKRCKGISISDYIASKRFDEVCRLLRETDLSAVQICLRTGMSANSYFYTAFKKHTGYTLEQYRKHYSNKK